MQTYSSAKEIHAIEEVVERQIGEYAKGNVKKKYIRDTIAISIRIEMKRQQVSDGYVEMNEEVYWRGYN